MADSRKLGVRILVIRSHVYFLTLLISQLMALVYSKRKKKKKNQNQKKRRKETLFVPVLGCRDRRGLGMPLALQRWMERSSH